MLNDRSEKANETTQDQPLKKEEERRLSRILDARKYLRSLGKLHNTLVSEHYQSGDPIYPGHPTGLTREQRTKLKMVMHDRLLPVSKECNISPEQHRMWCNNTIDSLLCATQQAITSAMVNFTPPPEEIWRAQMKYKAAYSSKAYYNLARIDPITACSALAVFDSLFFEENRTRKVQEEAGALCLGWYTESIEQAGRAFESLKALKSAISNRFKRKDLAARALLHGFISESERMITEACTYYYALGGVPSPGEVQNVKLSPMLFYWPRFPNQEVDYSDLKKYMDTWVFPAMEEIRPELRTDRNLKNRAVAIPVILHLVDVMWTVSVLGSIADSLTKAFTKGQMDSWLLEQHQALTDEVDIFTRPRVTPGNKGQARISLRIRPQAYDSNEFIIRFDLQDDGEVQIDVGFITLKKAMNYASALKKKEPYTYKEGFTEDGSLLRDPQSGRPLVIEEIKHARGLLSLNELLAFTTVSLSNLGYLMNLRDETVVSHHHPLTTRSRFSEDEFAEAVEAVRCGMFKIKP